MDENMQQPSQFYLIMKRIWPTIYRAINTIFFIIIKTIKAGVIIAYQQFKGGV